MKGKKTNDDPTALVSTPQDSTGTDTGRRRSKRQCHKGGGGGSVLLLYTDTAILRNNVTRFNQNRGGRGSVLLLYTDTAI